jgi:hypothetical protein
MKTRDQSAAIFNLHSSNLQHDTLQPRRFNTLNGLARRHFGGINSTYTYMLIWPGGVGLCKSKLSSYLCKTQVFP